MIRTVSIALLLAATVAAQDGNTSVPQNVLNQVGDLLPERSNSGSAFLSHSFSPNLLFTATATVEVVIIWEGAGYKNSLGYFTYTEDTDGNITVVDSDLIEPNVSFPRAGSLSIGDTYQLKDQSGAQRVFQAGERVGFFIIANGYNRSPVNNWTWSYPNVPSVTPLANENIGLGCFTSVDKINPEWGRGEQDKARHLAMVQVPGMAGFLNGNSFLLCGFEDINRTKRWCDQDFNDLVFVVVPSPMSAVSSDNLFVFNPGDPDNDGVPSTEDHFPDDPTRAYIVRYPTVGNNVIAFEDMYPEIGDADYNDAVIAYSYEQVLNADNQLVDLIGTFHLVARGARYESGFGLHIPGLPAESQGTLTITRRLGGQTLAWQSEPTMSLSDLVYQEKRRIMNIFPSTTTALPPPSDDWASNTRPNANPPKAGSARAWLHFSTPVATAALGDAPYDPFLYMQRYGDGIWDIHLPGKPAFADRSTHLPTEEGELTFLDDNGYPWALEVPTDWRFPMEWEHIQDCYLDFQTWRTSGGAERADWFLYPTEGSSIVGSPLLELLPGITWPLPAQPPR